MITAVLDTNVLASASLTTWGPIAQTLSLALAGAFQLAVSVEILVELDRTLRKPYFARFFSASSVDLYVDNLRAVAVLTLLVASVSGVASHPEDDVILATAVSASASHLVTGDKALQSLGTFQGVTILSPAAFVNLFEDPAL